MLENRIAATVDFTYISCGTSKFNDEARGIRVQTGTMELHDAAIQKAAIHVIAIRASPIAHDGGQLAPSPVATLVQDRSLSS